MTDDVSKVTLCVISVLILHLAAVSSSKIQFQATPATLLQGLTDTLTIHCAINDTAPSSGVIGRRDVTMTSDNVAEVSSLVIMKDGKDVASISHAMAAHVMDGSSNVVVRGSVQAGHETGYLELTITNPMPNQTGEYVCQTNAVSKTGHGVTFSSSLEVTSAAPSMADLVTYIRDVKDKCNVAVAFSVGLTRHTALLQSGNPLIFNRLYTNLGDGYDMKTGSFHCPVRGVYNFAVHAMGHKNQHLWLEIQFNGAEQVAIYCDDADNESCSNSVNLQCDVGDVVRVVTLHNSELVAGFGSDVYTTFSGQLIAAL